MNILDTIKKDAKTAKWVGIFSIIAGVLALISPFVAGLSVALMVGVLMLFVGVTQLMVVFKAGSFGQGLLLALLGVLTVVAGGYMIARPASALMTLTLFLAGYFIATGILEAVGAFVARSQKGWGWLLFNAVVSLLLGVMIWRQFPVSGAWAIGTLVGVRLLLSGWTLVAVASAAKGAAQTISEA